jgi:hypothetical protein
MRKRERSREALSHRENISILLEIFGLGPAEQRLIQIVSGVALFFSRIKFRIAAGVIPAGVFLAMVAYAAGAVALAVRKERTASGR